jgi:hypothetical protein
VPENSLNTSFYRLFIKEAEDLWAAGVDRLRGNQLKQIGDCVFPTGKSF